MNKARVSRALRRQVAERARECCEYCRSQERFAMQSFSAEHIKPRSQLGVTNLANLAWACQGCNNYKYNRTVAVDPLTGTTVPLFNPRQDEWAAHFAWNHDCSLILGLTPIGRATVQALQLNRRGLINLRKLLYGAALHPPA